MKDEIKKVTKEMEPEFEAMNPPEAENPVPVDETKKKGFWAKQKEIFCEAVNDFSEKHPVAMKRAKTAGKIVAVGGLVAGAFVIGRAVSGGKNNSEENEIVIPELPTVEYPELEIQNQECSDPELEELISLEQEIEPEVEPEVIEF